MRFKKGNKVEVFSKKDVPSGAWHCAEIICANGHNYTVRYAGCGSATAKTTVERVSRKVIRPCPPSLELGVLENWVPGDVVEVFDDFSWKMATVLRVLGEKYFLVRLLGSCLELKVCKYNIRARQSWQDDKWIVIRKGCGNCEEWKHDENLTLKYGHILRFQVQKTNTSRDLLVKDECIPAENKANFQESNIASSKTLKRGSPYHYSQVKAYAGAPQKFRAIEKEGRMHREVAASRSTLPEQVDVVAFPGEMLGEKFIHASFNKRTTGFSEVDAKRKKPTAAVGCSLAVNLESNDADSVTCSVGSCSITSNNSYKLPHVSASYIAGYIEDSDGHFSDAESFCQLGYEEGNCLLPTKEELAAEIHRLELHAYRCTIEALHASGPLSWEQEAMVTNLRLSLHISNDEHLMEIRNLVSADNSIPTR